MIVGLTLLACSFGTGVSWALDIGAPPPIAASQWLNTGAPMALDELKGKVVLLDFWGVWCSPCCDELPDLVELHEDLGDDGLVIITIHTPQKAEQVRDYLREQRNPLVVAIDTGGTATAYGVDAFPAYVTVDRAGLVVSVSDHPPRKGALRRLLKDTSHLK
jgi:thiol-disulfide isomerase/thioredoxin